MYDTNEIIKIVNKLRLDNKGAWYSYNTSDIKIKGFDTWLQIFKVGGIDHAGAGMDQSVKNFKLQLKKGLDYV